MLQHPFLTFLSRIKAEDKQFLSNMRRHLSSSKSQNVALFPDLPYVLFIGCISVYVLEMEEWQNATGLGT